MKLANGLSAYAKDGEISIRGHYALTAGEATDISMSFFGDRLVVLVDVTVEGDPIGGRVWGRVATSVPIGDLACSLWTWSDDSAMPAGMFEVVEPVARLAVDSVAADIVAFVDRAAVEFREEVDRTVADMERRIEHLKTLRAASYAEERVHDVA